MLKRSLFLLLFPFVFGVYNITLSTYLGKCNMYREAIVFSYGFFRGDNGVAIFTDVFRV